MGNRKGEGKGKQLLGKEKRKEGATTAREIGKAVGGTTTATGEEEEREGEQQMLGKIGKAEGGMENIVQK